MRLDQDWLAALLGARPGSFCGGSCSALVSVIVTAGREAKDGNQQQHREGGLDLGHGVTLSARMFCGQTDRLSPSHAKAQSRHLPERLDRDARRHLRIAHATVAKED